MEISTSKSVAEREDQGTIVHIQDESGEPQVYGDGDNKKPVTITVVGTYSKKYRQLQNQLRGQSVRLRGKPSGEDIDNKALGIIAQCILDWEGFTAEGKPFPYSKDNAIALLDAAPWIREQVEAAMSDHAGFFPKPSKG